MIALLLLAAALLVCRNRRRRRQIAQAVGNAVDGVEDMPDEEGVSIPRLRADKPRDAAAAMKQLRAPAAVVASPWRPEDTTR